MAETGSSNRPKWSLTSFPGSDETWAQQLIDGATGIYATLMSDPKVYESIGMTNTVEILATPTFIIKFS